ncbi:SDR family oxidoreductase [Pilimelia columellifera subsp. columellifera]|uniref:SDR family oxidoreductase n=1 Tax=Pilimelia columellifera subsp. columellifera TaxID=706583 RepID=A0ABP6AH34_9ACTN
MTLVTGATGYIGGRLIPELLTAGHRVRAMARQPTHLADRAWSDEVEVVRADVEDAASVAAAMRGVGVAYYLIHSLGAGRQFEAMDRHNAEVFATAAREAGVSRIVYLGGLYPRGPLSPHLRSRREVGRVLLASGVPTTVLQAAVILGSGSASFEMMRYLTERLPLMVTPRWVENRIQPIAVRDVLRYLVGAATMPAEVSRAFDIGGRQVLTYRQMMQRYAAVAGLPRRRIYPLPVLTPRLASRWVGLVTPVPSGLARPLVESLVHEVVCDEDDIRGFVPDPPEGLLDFDAAVRLALQKVRDEDVATTYYSAVGDHSAEPLPEDPQWAGGDIYVDERSSVVRATPQALWAVIEGIGGNNGWYSWQLGWVARGVIDKLFGGPGLRRGRRRRYQLAVGDALDWWRVEALEVQRLLRLRAEMRLPGKAWLELIVDADAGGRTVFRQRAIYYPRGLGGRAYWWVIAPFHGMVFGGMQRNIAAAAAAAQLAIDRGADKP